MRTSSVRHRTIRHAASVGHAGVAVAARRARSRRRPLSPGARAALAAYVPGTVLKAGSAELSDADIWTLVLTSQRDAPRLVRSGGGR